MPKRTTTNQKSTDTDVKVTQNIEVTETEKTIHLGERVKYLRLERGFKQEYMAVQLGISQQRYSDIEKQEDISDDTLKKIGEVLGVSIDWIKLVRTKKPFTSFHQDGNGNTNFQNTGDVNYAIHNPVEHLVEAFNITVESQRQQINDLREQLQREQERTDRLLNGVIGRLNM